MLENEDVLLKKESAISYCRIATALATNKLFKAWKYIFIPSKKIRVNSSFENLLQRFGEER